MRIAGLFGCPLGGVAPPQGRFKKCTPFLEVGLQALGQVGSGIANVISNNKTNKTNLAINREQLAAQRQQYLDEVAENRFLVNQQRQWSLADRDFENKYNSPAEMRRRYEAAGINPAFAMANGQGAFGSSTAETSTGTNPTSQVPSAPQMVAPDFSPIGMGVSAALAQYYQAKESERADYALASDIEFRNRKSIVDYMNALSEATKAGVARDTLEETKRQFDKNFTFQQDQAQKHLAIENDRIALEAERVQLEDMKVLIQRNLAASSIRLNGAQIAELAQSIQESRDRIDDLRKRGVDNHLIAEEERRIKGYTADRLMKQEGRYDRQNQGFRREVNDFVDWLYDTLPTRVLRRGR